jgi:hypothetical protein
MTHYPAKDCRGKGKGQQRVLMCEANTELRGCKSSPLHVAFRLVMLEEHISMVYIPLDGVRCVMCNLLIKGSEREQAGSEILTAMMNNPDEPAVVYRKE